MKINQEKFFDGLNFEKKFYAGKDCWLAPNGHYYRMDHFSMSYVIEYAENEDEADNGVFWDADLFNDDLPENELVKQVQAALISYVRDAEAERAEKEKAEAEGKKE